MAIDVKTLALAKKYTDNEVAGGGAIKGKNCTIKSKTAIEGGTRIVFSWYLDNGTEQTTTMDVMDGSKGDTGLGIKAVSVNSSNHLVVTYDDDTTEDAGEITNITTNVAHISDIALSNLTDGQILKYNATSGKWENASAGSVDTNLVDLNDVDVDDLTDGQIIVWDATNSKWVNADNEGGASALSDLTDTTITTPSDGEVLVYDGTAGKWVNDEIETASTLADLTDTNIGTPAAAEPLTYDAVNGKWINGGVILAANGGTGNNSGYVRAGARGTIGANATAEGSNTTASNINAHAEGYWTQSTGVNSHAEGDNSVASNGTAHAQNYHTTASGANSSSAGNYTVAGYQDQFVVGKFNDNKSTSIFEVGIGANANAKANGLELDGSGNLTVAGSVTDGDGNVLGDSLTASDVQNIKDAFVVPTTSAQMPILFDETGAEYVIGWYKTANGKKPVYQKSFYTTTPSSTSTANVATLPSNVDTVILVDGSVHRDGFDYPINYYYGNDLKIVCWVRRSENAIGMLVSSALTSLPARINLQYTKTTDTLV